MRARKRDGKFGLGKDEVDLMEEKVDLTEGRYVRLMIQGGSGRQHVRLRSWDVIVNQTQAKFYCGWMNVSL